MYNYILIIIFVLIAIIVCIILKDNESINFYFRKNEGFINNEHRLDNNEQDKSTYTMGISDIKGNFHLFTKNNDYEVISNNLELPEKLNVPKDFTFNSLGIYYKNNEIMFIKNYHTIMIKGKIYKLNELYTNINININIKSIIIVNKYTYFFLENNYIIYDNETNTIYQEGLITNIFNIDEYDFVLVNYNDSYYGNPYPMLYFVNKEHYYKYDIFRSKTYNKMPFKKSQFPNNELQSFEYTGKSQKHTINDTNIYRIICIGAGNENGGYGGKIFYDLPLTKGDELKIIVGKTGDKLPSVSNDLELKNNNLPLNSSSTGAGASYIFLNNNLLMVSGGGGGHSSLLVPCSKTSSSIKLITSDNLFNNKTLPNIGQLNYPLKSIIFITPLATTNKNYKLIINNLNLNDTSIYYEVSLIPNINNGFETGFCSKNKSAIIKIEFPTVLIDYNISFDVKVIDSQGNHYSNVNILLIDYLDREIFLKGYRKNTLNISNILEHLLNVKMIHDTMNSNNIDNKLANSGKSIRISNKNIYNGGTINNTDIFNAHCGGGSGYIGGNFAINDLTIGTMNNREIRKDEYSINGERIYMAVSSGGGGSSFINNDYINNEFDNELYSNNFIHNFNNSNGKVLIQKINNENEIRLEININHLHKLNSKINDTSEENNYNFKLTEDISLISIDLSDNVQINKMIYKIVFYPNDRINNSNMNTFKNKIHVINCFYVEEDSYIVNYKVPNPMYSKDIISEKLYNENNYNFNKLIAQHMCNLDFNSFHKNTISIDLNNTNLSYELELNTLIKTNIIDKLYFVIKAPILLNDYIDVELTTIESI
tara:strand:+ start:2037 stop:4505 length:2469 start_codon:yes stop_codon:yes gene_type:complete